MRRKEKEDCKGKRRRRRVVMVRSSLLIVLPGAFGFASESNPECREMSSA